MDEGDSKGCVSHPGHRGSESLGRDADRGVEGALSPRIWDPRAQAVHTAILAVSGAKCQKNLLQRQFWDSLVIKKVINLEGKRILTHTTKV